MLEPERLLERISRDPQSRSSEVQLTRVRDCNVFPEPLMSLSQLLCPAERPPRNEPETWEEANTHLTSRAPLKINGRGATTTAPSEGWEHW